MMKKTVLIALLLVFVLALAALIGLRVFGARSGEATSPAETSAASEGVPAAETGQPAPAAPTAALTPSEDTEEAGAADGVASGDGAELD